MSINRYSIHAFAISLFLCGACEAKDFNCPEKINIKPGTTEVSELPAGFKVTTSPVPLRLSYASLYDGPPKTWASKNQ
jgi:hypothetical protein